MKRLEKPRWQAKSERKKKILLAVAGGFLAVIVLSGAIYFISGIEFSETNVLASALPKTAGSDNRLVISDAEIS